MIRKRRKSGNFSFSLVYSSFFGALMIALAFAYYNHKFSQYNFIDFKKSVLYSDKTVFSPVHEKYAVVIYSSKRGDLKKALAKIESKNIPVIAIDLFMEKRGSSEHVTFLTAGTNTLLSLIHRFAIRKVPSFFLIKRENENGLYKQDSKVYTLL